MSPIAQLRFLAAKQYLSLYLGPPQHDLKSGPYNQFPQAEWHSDSYPNNCEDEDEDEDEGFSSINLRFSYPLFRPLNATTNPILTVSGYLLPCHCPGFDGEQGIGLAAVNIPNSPSDALLQHLRSAHNLIKEVYGHTLYF